MSTEKILPVKLGQPHIKQSAKVLGKGRLDESRTVVTGGGNAVQAPTNGAREVVDISSDSSEGEEEEDGEEEIGDSEDGGINVDAEAASAAEGDVAMLDADTPIPNHDVEEAGEPSFGDLVRANASEPIDVAAAFEDDDDRAVTYALGAQIQAPSGASLGTVLTQALRTNDVSLLESCLHTPDVSIIRATIQRLDSPLAGALLQKLAERLHRRPGRAGSLMVWVQWTLVTHGGYLATQPALMRKLVQLNRVIDERARSLQSLLSLKGKLDMLEAQIELRKSMQRRRMEDEDVDEGVIYVEGQESDGEDATTTALVAAKEPKKITTNGGLMDFSGSEISEDMPTTATNGMIADSEDEEEGDSSDEDGVGLVDDEAEETDAEEGEGEDKDEVDFDDQDSEGDDVESDDDAAAAVPPSKMQRRSR